MVGTDGIPEAYVSSGTDVFVAILFAILFSFFVIAIFIYCFCITSKKENPKKEEYKKQTEKNENISKETIVNLIKDEVKKEIQKIELDEEAIVNFIKEEIKTQLNNSNESD